MVRACTCVCVKVAKTVNDGCVLLVSHSVTCVITSRVCHVGFTCNKNTNDTWEEVVATLNNNTMKVQM